MPTFNAPDENAHVDLIRGVAGDDFYPAYDAAYHSEQVQATVGHFRIPTPGRWVREDAVDRGERLPFAAFGPDRPTAARNQMPQHPPLYYLGFHVVSRMLDVLPGDMPADLLVAWLRVVNISLIAGLPLLASAAAVRLGMPRAAGVAAAAVPLTIPQLASIGGGVNNDNLLILLIGIVTVLAIGPYSGSLRWSEAAGIGVFTGLALLTKGFALFLPLLIAGAYASAALRSRRPRDAAAQCVVALSVASAVGGWWWIHNVLAYGGVQTGIGSLPPAPPSFAADATFWTNRFANAMQDRFWSGFGLLQGYLPRAMAPVATGVVAASCAAAMARRLPAGIGRAALVLLTAGAGAAVIAAGEEFGYFRIGIVPSLPVAAALVLLAASVLGALIHTRARRPLTTGLADVLFMTLPVFAIAAMVSAGAWTAYEDTGQTPGLQGRYLFPAVVSLSPVVAAGLTLLLFRFRACAGVVIFAAAAGMQVTGIGVALTTFWGPADGDLLESASAALAWSAWPPQCVVAVWVLLAVGAVPTSAAFWAAARANVEQLPERPPRFVAAEERPRRRPSLLALLLATLTVGTPVAVATTAAFLNVSEPAMSAPGPILARFVASAARADHATSGWLQVTGISKAVVTLPPGSRISTRLTIRQSASQLTFVVGVAPGSWKSLQGPLTMRVNLVTRGQRRALLVATVDPPTRPADRRWVTLSADVAARGGRTVTLELAVDETPGPAVAVSWADFALR